MGDKDFVCASDIMKAEMLEKHEKAGITPAFLLKQSKKHIAGGSSTILLAFLRSQGLVVDEQLNLNVRNQLTDAEAQRRLNIIEANEAK